MNELTTNNLTINSREVADMVGIKHKNLLKKIEGMIEVLSNELNFEPVEYFLKSSYLDAKGETRKCYEVTKKGCEMVAHKTTGKKGILFTATYIERFHQMEEQLKDINKPSYMIENPIERAKAWIKEQEEKQLLQERQERLIHSTKTYTVTELAKELGYKSAMALNKELHKRGIQYKQSGTWVLYSKYSDKGYVSIKQTILDDGRVIYNTKWTSKGRDWLINEVLC